VAFVHFSNPPNKLGTGVGFDLNAGLAAAQVRYFFNGFDPTPFLGVSDID
jgi:hypothetical protein